jgi:hypothetical protein
MELIDREALKTKLEKMADMNNPKWSYDSMMIAKIMIEILNEAPIVEERKNGHWKCEDYLLGTTHRCSRCGENYGMPHKIYNFCPNCGAKMENNGDDDNE